ncbi:LuxR C-terminal-related transcriptional regulator [Parendozoicomonas sp. Alg238-R29]|uniref:helix-turn-helix transcriptional regulator n=1 Tax=Parendozoicomonas sp. Alg238-R29 TaxID=2993446 RepID=UPI00248E8DC7|nr:LuxR C-terminal-related transcriptional regulator [Parendozoicomonas sp. Alg238-R29]
MKTTRTYTGPRFKVVPNNDLTERDSESLLWVVEDKDAETAGILMGLSLQSSRTYRQRLLNKMDVHSLYGLVAEAFRRGIVSPLVVALVICQAALEINLATSYASNSSQPLNSNRIPRKPQPKRGGGTQPVRIAKRGGLQGGKDDLFALPEWAAAYA